MASIRAAQLLFFTNQCPLFCGLGHEIQWANFFGFHSWGSDLQPVVREVDIELRTINHLAAHLLPAKVSVELIHLLEHSFKFIHEEMIEFNDRFWLAEVVGHQFGDLRSVTRQPVAVRFDARKEATFKLVPPAIPRCNRQF